MDIRQAIDVERAYQDQKWGGAEHDDTQETPATWRGYILEYISGTGRAASYEFKVRLVKAAALATAALESYYRLHREPTDRVSIVNAAFNLSTCCPGKEAEVVAEIQYLVQVSESNYVWAMRKIIALVALACN